MARYIVQMTITPQATATVLQNPQNRAEAVAPVLEAAGGKLEHYFLALGENTAYLVVDFPDPESVGAVSFAVFAGGAVSAIKSTPIVTAEEAVDVMKKAASVIYRPPSS